MEVVSPPLRAFGSRAHGAANVDWKAREVWLACEATQCIYRHGAVQRESESPSTPGQKRGPGVALMQHVLPRFVRLGFLITSVGCCSALYEIPRPPAESTARISNDSYGRVL